MLHQKRSGSLARLKYLIAVPLCAGLLCESTMGFSKTYGWIDLAPQHLQQASTLTITMPDTGKKPANMTIGKIIPSHGKAVPPPPPPEPPKRKVKVTDVKLLPPPPPPEPRAPRPVRKPRVASDVRVKITDVKLAPPRVERDVRVKTTDVKLASPRPERDVHVKTTDVKLAPPPPPKRKVDVIKFPKPVITPNKAKPAPVKFPKPVITRDSLKRN